MQGSILRLGLNIPIGGEDGESLHNLSHWDALVVLPLLKLCCGLNKDNKVVALALEVNSGLHSLALHICGCVFGNWVSFVKVVIVLSDVTEKVVEVVLVVRLCIWLWYEEGRKATKGGVKEGFCSCRVSVVEGSVMCLKQEERVASSPNLVGGAQIRVPAGAIHPCALSFTLRTLPCGCNDLT